MKKNAVILCLIVSLILAVITNQKCVPDDRCDPDPIRGGCPQSCEFTGNPWGIVGKTFGFYILLNLGYIVREREEIDEYKKRIEKGTL